LTNSKNRLDDAEVWSMYWSGGHKHSCIASKASEDREALDSYWQQQAAILPEGAKVLDMACGNGAVSFAIATARPDLIIDAIDKSELSASLHQTSANKNNLRFIDRTDILDLPESLSGYDLICSQFGIEYAGLELLPEILVSKLAPEGKISLLVHHQEGDLFRSTKRKVQEHQLIEEHGLLHLLREFLSNKPTDRKRSEKALIALEAAGQRFVDKSIGTKAIAGQIFDAIGYILGKEKSTSESLLKQVDSLINNTQAEKERLLQMIAASQSRSMMQDFNNQLAKVGIITGVFSEFFVGSEESKYLLAWRLEAQNLSLR